MKILTLSEFNAGDVRVRYQIQQPENRVGLVLIPTPLVGQVADRRTVLNNWPEIAGLPSAMRDLPANAVDSLAHLKLTGSPCTPCHGQGRTMRDAPDTMALQYVCQRRTEHRAGWTVTTILHHPVGAEIEHCLSWDGETPALTSRTIFINRCDQPLKLELLTSFSLGGITPFASDDSPRRLVAHRFRSAWSAEGFHEALPFEALHLEPSWQSSAIRCERFGQLGSFPINGFHPWAAIEDKEAGVFWGACLAWGASWQMEFFRRCDTAALSGGLADREFGHWMKTVAPGEQFESPTGYLACCRGSIDDLCDRLRAPMEMAIRNSAPPSEQDLPIIFNEWCTTWGNPSHDRVTAIADRLKESPVRYLVLDAGWYRKDEDKPWHSSHGDWIPNGSVFPDGLKATVAAIRARGLVPGLWFEYETVGKDSRAWKSPLDHFLLRDGVPIEVAGRRFWNLNHPTVVEFLLDRVVARLQQDGFGYVKIDYNATVGIGADHPDSLSEGLRQQTLAVYRFIEAMRATMPELVMENCASGGHRLEPSFMMRHAMASFSDAHETLEIPVIAANLQRLIPPRQSQIWAVLHRADDDKRLRYSLAATFLGRMCLSGEIEDLSENQWALVRQAMALYRQIWPVIADGTSRRYGTPVDSHRHLRGGQVVVRMGACGERALVVVHGFDGGHEQPISFPDLWAIERRFGLPDARMEDKTLCVSIPPGDAGVLLLARIRPKKSSIPVDC